MQYKSITCFFFPLTALLPVQDVCSDAQTHLGAIPIHTLGRVMRCRCYRCYSNNDCLVTCPLQPQDVHNIDPTRVWPSSIFFGKKMDQAKGRPQKKKKKKQAQQNCTACNNNCAHVILGQPTMGLVWYVNRKHFFTVFMSNS